MRILLFSFSFLITLHVSAQNLVPNPSFEEYVDCPSSTATLDIMVTDWFSFGGSPDFFHACNNAGSGFVGVPNNVAGEQEAIIGDGYAGLVNFCHLEPNCREYMAAPLSTPMIAGEEYYCMFYFSQYDGGDWWNVDCSSSHVGMKFFSNLDYNEQEPFIPDNQADLDYNQIVTDTVSWIKVEGFFVADQNYDWVALGNFFDDDNTEVEIHNDWNGCYGYTYIENVCVALSPQDCDYLVTSSEMTIPNDLVEITQQDSFVKLKSPVAIERILIFDSSGKLLGKSKTRDVWEWEFDLASFSNGLYLITIELENGRYFSEKIIFR